MFGFNAFFISVRLKRGKLSICILLFEGLISLNYTMQNKFKMQLWIVTQDKKPPSLIITYMIFL